MLRFAYSHDQNADAPLGFTRKWEKEIEKKGENSLKQNDTPIARGSAWVGRFTCCTDRLKGAGDMRIIMNDVR